MRLLGDPPPGIPASGSRSAARPEAMGSRTVLGGKGTLRRGGPASGHPRHALASCAPFCWTTRRDGQLRREPEVQKFLRPAKDENQCGVDNTS